MKLIIIALAFSILLMQLSCDSQSPSKGKDEPICNIKGRVLSPSDMDDIPFVDALVKLMTSDSVLVDSTYTLSDGVFYFYNVPEGIYFLEVYTDLSGTFIPSVSITIDDTTSCFNVGDITIPIIIVLAPAIYLYPEETIPVEVTLNFSVGMITVSEPEYNSGWSVVAELDGTIDGEYPYLFYEAIVPESPFQHELGFSVAREEISDWLALHLAEWSFTESEIDNFVSFWSERLVDRPYYTVYPQTASEIDEMVELHVSPAPDNVLRLWFLFMGSDQPTELPSYQIPPVQRDGFFVLEWGGILVDSDQYINFTTTTTSFLNNPQN